MVDRIDQQPELVKEIRILIFDKNPRKTMRATWLMQHIAFKHPDFIKKEIPYLLECLDQNNNHSGAIRNCIRLFMSMDLPSNYCSEIFDKCVAYATNTTLPHAVRVFSIYTMANNCIKFPELKPELMLILMKRCSTRSLHHL